MSRRYRARRAMPVMWRVAVVFVLAAVVPVVVTMRAGIPWGVASGFALAAAFVLSDLLAAARRRRYRRRRTTLVDFTSVPASAMGLFDEDAYLSRRAATRHAAAGSAPDPWSWDREHRV